MTGTGDDALCLSLDQGGGSSRALIFDSQGQLQAKAQVAVATAHPKPGWVEQDPRALVDSLRQAALTALAQLPRAQRLKVDRCGLVCQRSSLVCLNQQSNQPLTAVISWQDVRAADRFAPDAEAQAWFRHHTGLFPSPHHGASKLRWCLHNLPEVRAAARHNQLLTLPLAGYLAAALCDFRSFPRVDQVSAQRTLLWSRRHCGWDADLLDYFGISPGWLPELAPGDSHWGDIKLADLSLPLRFVGGDQATALFSDGEPRRNQASINIGTGAFITLPWPASTPPPERLLHSLVCDVRGQRRWALEATINGAASALNWLQGQDGKPKANERQARWLAEVQRPALFINAVGGLGSPYWRSDIPSRFIGATGHPQRWAAVIESILFLITTNLEQIARAGALQRISLSGGVSQLTGLPQRLADLSGLPVTLNPETEASARGLAWLLTPNSRHWVSATGEQFTPHDNPKLSRRYRRWQRVMALCLQSPRQTSERIG